MKGLIYGLLAVLALGIAAETNHAEARLFRGRVRAWLQHRREVRQERRATRHGFFGMGSCQNCQ